LLAKSILLLNAYIFLNGVIVHQLVEDFALHTNLFIYLFIYFIRYRSML